MPIQGCLRAKLGLSKNITKNPLNILPRILKKSPKYHKKCKYLENPLNISYFCRKETPILNHLGRNFQNILAVVDVEEDLRASVLPALPLEMFLNDGRQPEVYVFPFSKFSCPTNELQSSHFSIYNLTFSTK